MTSLTNVEQAFYDSLCGLTNDACPNGDGNVCANDGVVCTTDADCTPPDPNTCVADAGTCNLDNDDCQQEITQAVITFEVDGNPDAGCATEVVRTEGATQDFVKRPTLSRCITASFWRSL